MTSKVDNSQTNIQAKSMSEATLKRESFGPIGVGEVNTDKDNDLQLDAGNCLHLVIKLIHNKLKDADFTSSCPSISRHGLIINNNLVAFFTTGV